MFSLLPFNSVADDSIDIYTATKGGDYYAAGQAIRDLLNKRDGYEVKLHHSDGSVDNFNKMLDGKAELAIIQSDVLYRKSYGGKSPNKNGEKITSIAALFPEYIQFIVHRDSGINKVLKLAGKKLYLGPKDSGSYANAIEILKQFNIEKSDFTVSELPKGVSAVNALEKGTIDAIIKTSGILDTNKDFKLLTFDHSFVEMLTKLTPYYSYKPYLNSHNLNSHKQQYLLYVRAVLSVRNKQGTAGLSQDVVTDITQAIYQDWVEIEKNTELDLEFFSRQLIARKVSIGLHPAAEKYYVNQGVIADFGWSYIFSVTIFGFISFVIVVRHFFMDKKVIEKLVRSKLVRSCYTGRIKSSWDVFLLLTTSHTWLMLILVFAFIVVLDLSIINYFEDQYAHNYDVANPFAGKSVIDILFWLLTFAVTGFNQDIFPNSMPSKISSVVIPIFAVLGGIFIVINRSANKNRREDKLLRGLTVPDLTDHIVICGWNDRVPEIVENLLSSYIPDDLRKILIIADVDEDKPLEKFKEVNKKVFYYRGLSSSYQVLTDIAIAKSFCAIVLADDKKVQSGNFRSVLTVSAIRDLTKKDNPGYPIIAEAFFAHNISYFEKYDVQRLVCIQSYATRLLSHAIVNPGVSDILLNLMAFEPPYQLAEEPASEYQIDQKTYADTVKKLRKQNILLLGVYRANTAIPNKAHELEFSQDHCRYISNPISGSNTIVNDDRLIILRNNPDKVFDNSNHIQRKSFDAVDCAQENILVIGDSEVTTELCTQIALICHKVTQLKISERIDEVLTQCEYNGEYHVYQSGDLITALMHDDIGWSDINRVLVLSIHESDGQNHRGVHVDDGALKIVTGINHHVQINKAKLPHIASEIREMDNRQLFYNADVDQLIPTNKLIEEVISRMVFHNGRVSGFIVKAMSYSEQNHMVRIEKWSAEKLCQEIGIDLKGKDYDEIIECCMPSGIQLIAMETTTKTSNKKVIINPIIGSEDNRVGLGDNDKVYLLVNTKRKTGPIIP